VTTLSELGKFLKQGRIEKDLSLDDIQEITKIRKRYLEAIEIGEYSILPGHFYERAFVKSYAEAIGMNSEEVLDQFADELPVVSQNHVETMVPKRNKEVRTTSPGVAKWVSKLVLYSFFFILLFVAYLGIVKYVESPNGAVEPTPNQGATAEGEIGTKDNANEDKGDAEAAPATEPTSEPEAGAEPEPAPPSQQEAAWTRMGTQGKTTTFEYTNAPKMNVTLQATTGEVWYSLSNAKDDKVIQSEKLSKGLEATWDLSQYEEVRLRLGNSHVVNLLINGVQVDITDLPQVHNIAIQYKPQPTE
jgi:cytoskeletal protein RodZ